MRKDIPALTWKTNPDLCKVAEAFGAAGIRVTKTEEVRKAIEESLKINDRPTLIDFRVAKEENVLPFVPPARRSTKCWWIDMKHTISVLVENKPGVLSRVSGLFSRRGFNIESLAVGTTEIESVSRMTIVASGDDHVLEQITKQLYKLIDVIKVFDIPQEVAR